MTLSLCITSLNTDKTIERTLDSVFKQLSLPDEIIILDAYSEDKTLQKINLFKKKKPNLIKVFSLKDKGISMGFNNTWRLAKGAYVIHLNADDILLPHAIQTIKKFIKKNYDIFISPLIFKSEDKNQIIIPTLPQKNKITFKHPKVNHCGFVIKKKILDELNGYSESFKVAMDIDLIFRAIQKHKKIYITNKVFAIQYNNGFSSKNLIKGIYELMIIEQKFYSNNKRLLSKILTYFVFFFRFLNLFWIKILK